MPDKKVIQIARWCALLAVLLMISFFVIFSVAPTSPIGVLLAIAGVFVLTPVFYALYLLHRSESAMLSLAGFLFWFPAGILDILSLLNHENKLLYIIDSFIFPIPILIFGWLAMKSTKMSTGIAMTALMSGMLYLVSGITTAVHMDNIAMASGLGGLVLMLVWFVWLFFIFSKENRSDTISPKDQA
jgi:hypothetical protein